MARILTYLAVFFLTMNLFSGIVMSSGVGDMLGIERQVGGEAAVQESLDNAEEVQSGAPTGSTLFGLYNVVANGVATLATPVTAGPTMLERAGLPGLITHGLLQPIIAIVYALAIMSFLRGYGVI